MTEEYREEFAEPESSEKACKLQCAREDRDIKVREERKLLDDCRSPKIVKKVVKYSVFVKATNSKRLEVVKTGCKIKGFRDFRCQHGPKMEPRGRQANATSTLHELWTKI